MDINATAEVAFSMRNEHSAVLDEHSKHISTIAEIIEPTIAYAFDGESDMSRISTATSILEAFASVLPEGVPWKASAESFVELGRAFEKFSEARKAYSTALVDPPVSHHLLKEIRGNQQAIDQKLQIVTEFAGFKDTYKIVAQDCQSIKDEQLKGHDHKR